MDPPVASLTAHNAIITALKIRSLLQRLSQFLYPDHVIRMHVLEEFPRLVCSALFSRLPDYLVVAVIKVENSHLIPAVLTDTYPTRDSVQEILLHYVLKVRGCYVCIVFHQDFMPVPCSEPAPCAQIYTVLRERINSLTALADLQFMRRTITARFIIVPYILIALLSQIIIIAKMHDSAESLISVIDLMCFDIAHDDADRAFAYELD